MEVSPVPSVTLADVDACIMHRRTDLRFSAPIEAAFEQYLKDDRARFIKLMTIPLLIIYNSFAPLELFVFHALLSTVIFHLFISLTIILSDVIIRKKPSRIIRECANAFPFILIVIDIMFVYRMGTSTVSDQYAYLAVLCAVHMNINRRFSFATSLWSSTIYIIIFSIAMLSGSATALSKYLALSMMGCTLLMTIGACWRMERDERYGFIRTLRDTIILKNTETAAFYDILTGLPNRRLFEQTTSKFWQESEAITMAGMLIIDVDRFKMFNDFYGHPAGDSCLKRVGDAIASGRRDKDDLGVRFGGEEFIVFLPNADLPAAIRVAERIRLGIEGLAIPHEALGPDRVVTASIGVMAAPVSEQTPADLTALADSALYKAKGNGRNQVWPRPPQVVARLLVKAADQRTSPESPRGDIAARG